MQKTGKKFVKLALAPYFTEEFIIVSSIKIKPF